MSNRPRTPAQRRIANSSSFSSSNSSFPNGSHRKLGSSKRQHSPGNNQSDDVGHTVSSTGRRHHDPDGGDADVCAVAAQSSLLQPRMAVVLGLSKRWHPLLFVCRLLSIGPAVWWGLPSALRLLVMLHLLLFNDQASLKGGNIGVGTGAAAGAVPGPGTLASAAATTTSTTTGSGYTDMPFEARLRLTEALLATVWCGASGYLSFFFTDCLMSRWLLNYTPQATLIRLLTISAINAYLTSCALSATGASADPRLLLPAWIAISTTLTAMYHVTQRKINIRKETSMSMSVFSIASFISMVMLLWQVHSNRTDYPDIPLATMARRAWKELVKVALAISDYGNTTGYIFK